MSSIRKSFGATGERTAEEYLVGLGFQIVERNYRCSLGEIDIIAIEGSTLVFVEVKARSSRVFGLPEEAVTQGKIERIARVGEIYRRNHPGLPVNSRIDVVAVETAGKSTRLIRNATG